MLSLLLGAGANVNAREYAGKTPLYYAINALGHSQPALETGTGPSSEVRATMITELLRAGASLDTCRATGDTAEDIIHRDETAEDTIRSVESWGSATLAENEHWLATKRLVAGVRKYGTYKRYMRAPHRDVLAVRGLAQRGKLSTRDPVLNFLARLGDNGVCWHILSFWRATN